MSRANIWLKWFSDRSHLGWSDKINAKLFLALQKKFGLSKCLMRAPGWCELVSLDAKTFFDRLNWVWFPKRLSKSILCIGVCTECPLETFNFNISADCILDCGWRSERMKAIVNACYWHFINLNKITQRPNKLLCRCFRLKYVINAVVYVSENIK